MIELLGAVQIPTNNSNGVCGFGRDGPYLTSSGRGDGGTLVTPLPPHVDEILTLYSRTFESLTGNIGSGFLV